MAQILFSEGLSALGSRVLPQGLSLLGNQISGATLGRAAGAMLGRAVDQAFADPLAGPRLKTLHVMESREGSGIANVYGRMRVAGQLIWASRLKEIRRETRVGGKGGVKTAQYAYAVSLAVALAEGPVQAVRRVWANGEAFDLASVTHRFYAGDETQEADALITLLRGAAPAYRGISYIVFEDLPLESFGNRLPHFSFEIVRAPSAADEPGLGDVVAGVNLIPASGEFVYATEIVRDVLRPGVERAINANGGDARADFLVALDQLEAELPRAKHAALTIGWFGTSLDAAICEIKPGVESAERVTLPEDWHVAGLARHQAHAISRDANGAVLYGGTPSDRAVVQAITELKRRGIAVTLTPFLFMDAPGLPWRGRISVAVDKSAAARNDIQNFVARSNGYRRFILHMAALGAQAGGVEAFLIGTEMRGLTRVRDHNGSFPFVEALIALAAEVKQILPEAHVSYAADWTEYGAYVPDDGSNDVLFPLDALWASPDVSFVGIDWYPPIGDWRDGSAHLDALAGFKSADDRDYLESQIAGGEAFDWYYASAADRAAQVRMPINDSAHAEHWVFRAKDLSGWAGALHYPRPGGVRATVSSAWTPHAKPIRLSEIGFAAVDKGGNAPNLFLDPKSIESALPPYSNGMRDDVFQRRALAATRTYFAAHPQVEAMFVWAYDARPFPAWPMRTDVWGDGANWARGHWLNGRGGLAPLSAVVADLCARAGVVGIDVSGLDGLVEGYALEGVTALRGALEPLRLAFGFDTIERAGEIVFAMAADAPLQALPLTHMLAPGIEITQRLIEKAPERLQLTYIGAGGDYQPNVAEARVPDGDPRLVTEVVLPLVLSASRADAVAIKLLAERRRDETADLAVTLAHAALEAGDRVETPDGRQWRIEEISERGATRALTLVKDVSPLAAQRASDPPQPAPAQVFGAAPELIIIDGARLPSERDVTGPLVAVFAAPWLGEIDVFAGVGDDRTEPRVRIERPAMIGRLTAPVLKMPSGRWDRATRLRAYFPDGRLESVSPAQVLNGANVALLETDLGWECVQFARAELIGPDVYEVSDLLRAQAGTHSGAANPGARFVLADGAMQRANVSAAELGLELIWQAGATTLPAQEFEDRANLPWPVASMRRRGAKIAWTRRGADLPESWALPEATAEGRFHVQLDYGAGFGAPIEQSAAFIVVSPGLQRVRVASVGADGRAGPAGEYAL